MVSQPGRGRDGDDDDLTADPPPFSDEGMRRIIYGQDRGEGRARDSRSTAFADDTAELEADLRGRRSLVPIVTALAALFCFGAIVWYAYTWGTGQMSSEELPLVRAQPMPEKVRPEQPGGMDVPHQGIAVLNNGSDGNPQESVERLLPRPESPEPPPPLPSASAQAGPEKAPETAQVEPEDMMPAPVPEAPLMADGSDADVTEAPMQMAEEGGIAKPIPKPAGPEGGGAAQGDQIAALLEQEPLETANGKPTENAGATPAQTQTAAVTAGDVVLQLSSVTSEAAAAQEWKRLQAAHPGLLGTLALSVESAVVKGKTYYRVQTGPFASREAAADLCTRLKAQNQDCLVTQR